MSRARSAAAGAAPGGAREDAPGGRRATVHARTRDEILDAAAGLVNERGVDALNLNELAARAGFGNAASLYRYFEGKQDIVGALASRGLERLGDYMRRVPEDLPPDEQIVAICMTYLEYARGHPGERRVLLSAAGSKEPDFRAAALPDEFVRRMFRLGEAARESGALRVGDEDDVLVILHALWALAHGMAEYDALYEGQERELLRSRHRDVFRACVAGFRGDWRG
jgi:AcrR family transcriptional regulator